MKEGDLVQLIFNSYITDQEGGGQSYEPCVPYLFHILSNPKDEGHLVSVYCITTNEKTEFDKAFFTIANNFTGTKVKKIC